MPRSGSITGRTPCRLGLSLTPPRMVRCQLRGRPVRMCPAEVGADVLGLEDAALLLRETSD